MDVEKLFNAINSDSNERQKLFKERTRDILVTLDYLKEHAPYFVQPIEEFYILAVHHWLNSIRVKYQNSLGQQSNLNFSPGKLVNTPNRKSFFHTGNQVPLDITTGYLPPRLFNLLTGGELDQLESFYCDFRYYPSEVEANKDLSFALIKYYFLYGIDNWEDTPTTTAKSPRFEDGFP